MKRRRAFTVVHGTPLDFQGARVDGLKSLPFEKGLFAGTGTIESPVLAAPLPFDDLVGSWNAELPTRSSLELSVQVQIEGLWSAWYGLGRWDAQGGRSLGRQEDSLGSVDIDTLRLKQKATAFRYRARMSNEARPSRFFHADKSERPSRGARTARLLRVAFTGTDASIEPDLRISPFRPGPWVRELKLRPRSQMEEQAKYKCDICSPTSLSMVLEFWGRRCGTMEMVHAVQDRAAETFGNWTLNIAAAARRGLSGQISRLNGFDELQGEIAKGRPVPVSITVEPGELTGFPLPRSRGHFVLVAGFTKKGDVITFDPAAPARKGVRRVYRRAEFAKVWLARKRGLAYMLGPRFPEILTVGIPADDLRRRPRKPKKPDPHDRNRLTQLLYGEKVRALEAKGDWVRIEAVEQPSFLPRSRWHDYAGWVRADSLVHDAAQLEPNAVIRVKKAAASDGPTLSIGTRIRIEREDDGEAYVRLYDGRSARLSADRLRRLPPAAPSAERILAAAEEFIGTTYVWGGRSGVHANPAWGVDCSGLVNLSYRVEGIDRPRDAHEQFMQAAPLRRVQLRPADLIFLSKPGDSKRITHVMLYAGGDDIIESRDPKAVKTTFRERFGLPLSAIESGDAVTDLTGDKPAKRRIYFGGYLHR